MKNGNMKEVMIMKRRRRRRRRVSLVKEKEIF